MKGRLCVTLKSNMGTNIFFFFSLPFVPFVSSLPLYLIFHNASFCASPPAPYPPPWLSRPPPISLSHPAFCCFLLVWPRPVHSEHQIRFTGCYHTSPSAAEQRASHPDGLPWKWWNSTWPHLPHLGRPVHLTSTRPAHPSYIHLQPQLPWASWHSASPWTRPHT